MGVVVVETVTLDGVMQAPGRPDEDTRNGFDRGGWAGPFMAAEPDAATAAMRGLAADSAGMLFGRRTYLDLVGFWLGPDAGENPFTAVIHDAPKHVVTATLPGTLPFPNSTRVEHGVDGVAELRAATDGDLVVLGSGRLVRALLERGLVDQLALTTVPIVLGFGTRVFDGAALDLDTIECTAFPSGVTVARYRIR